MLLTVFPLAKLVGLGIKGAVMGTKTIIRFGDDAVQLFKKVYNALDPTIVKNMIHATYQQVVKGPLVDTANYLKKIRREIGNIHLPTGMGWVPAGAADGIHSYTVRDAVEGAKDTLVMAGGRAKGFVDEAFGKGIDNANRLIPSTPGVVTGGNSNKLGKSMLEDMGLKRSTKWSGYQA
ncbi:hypothetical protein [Bacillus coahuilensis]|uniref:hypothetical protein n=1 Tax=Bacillus coahuilensis TaxID=408580 RepID=UPI001F4C993E|nr:hypothetical protein [Bacillus coahuilensis]